MTIANSSLQSFFEGFLKDRTNVLLLYGRRTKTLGFMKINNLCSSSLSSPALVGESCAQLAGQQGWAVCGSMVRQRKVNICHLMISEKLRSRDFQLETVTRASECVVNGEQPRLSVTAVQGHWEPCDGSSAVTRRELSIHSLCSILSGRGSNNDS